MEQQKPTDWSAKRRQDTEEVVSKLTDWLNSTNNTKTMFYEMMDKEHRYLQGEFASLCAHYLLHCTEQNYGYDDRNAHAVRLGKALNYGLAHFSEIK